MIEIMRRLQFCAGHRVVGHEGKCARAHGHNYTVWAYARPNEPGELDKIGRVVDFGVLKSVLGGYIELYMDHGFIVWIQDKELLDALAQLGTKIYTMDANPTAENIAKHLLHQVCPQLFDDQPFKIVMVTVDETDNCSATAMLDD